MFLCFGAGGCQTHPTAMTNPFASPDRVPPPATRTLLPGQAAPYYPGDPLPTMQGATTGGPAAWAAAGETQPRPENVARQPAPRQATAVFASESSVKIPTDNDPLRAELPPRPEPQSSAAPGTLIAAATTRPAVSQAIHNQTIANVGPQTVPAFAAESTGAATDSSVVKCQWRSPQIARQNAAPTISLAPIAPPGQRVAMTQQSMLSAAPQPVLNGPPGGPQTMGVRLRSVPSPPPQPGEVPVPRIRLPGHASSQAAPYNTGGVEQAANYGPVIAAPAVWPGSVVQTVPVAPLPSAALVPASTVAVANGRDGFRPRSSMR
jgi:hypothetical protein